MRKALSAALASSAIIAVLSAGMPAEATVGRPIAEPSQPHGEGGGSASENIPEGGIPDEQRE